MSRLRAEPGGSWADEDEAIPPDSWVRPEVGALGEAMRHDLLARGRVPIEVAVRGIQAPPPDTWVEVTGTWIPRKFGGMPNGVVYPEPAGTDLTKVGTPDEPHE